MVVAVKKKKYNYAEAQSQRTLFKWISYIPLLRDVSFAIPNAYKRAKISGRLLKLEGMTAGVPDIFIAFPSHPFHGLFIEMKSEKGRLTEAQVVMLDRLTQQGYKCAVCYTWEEAKNVIITYLNGSLSVK
jgi:hypothetical protein